jgi:hypothetical protein
MQLTQAEVIDHAEGARVVLPEVLGENFDGNSLAQSLASKPVIVFDFDRVGLITSYGIREWVRFLKMLPDSSYYCFVRCTPAVVTQLNAITTFPGRGEVLSIYLPYVCPECDERSELLLDVQHEQERLVQLRYPRMSCSRCEIESELDEVPEVYFSYVSKCAKPSPREPALAMMASAKGRRGKSAVSG